jgi:hypothetical protein
MKTLRHETKVAWACAFCGHIRGAFDSRRYCIPCGASPAQWESAPMVENHRADADVRPVSEPEPELLSTEQTNSPSGLFATSAPGTEGVDVNPELRVRY